MRRRAPPPLPRGSSSTAAVKAARAQLLAEQQVSREEEARFVFNKYDSSSSGLNEQDLLRCFSELAFSNGRQNKTEEETLLWVRRELKRADKRSVGRLCFEDFLEYYNRYVVGHRRQFDETYELGPQIGKGAFGFVYRAKRIGGLGGAATRGEFVAVKQVEKAEGNAAALELLHTEITIWEQLKHPNLVMLLDVFETEERLYLVTELMRGGDLFRRLEKETSFSELVASRLAYQIISAVAYLHDHGVVHCDLKPSNILVAEKEEDGETNLTVKIADFGLSQLCGATGCSTALTEVCGTPDYFAPELVALAVRPAAVAGGDKGAGAEAASSSISSLSDDASQGYGPPIDAWAIGCIVYELLAGRPPYQAQDEAVLFYLIGQNAIEFPSDPFGSVSPAAVELVRQLMRTDPAERLSCGDALAHAWLADGKDADGEGGTDGGAAPRLSSTPLSAGLASKRRKSCEMRSVLLRRPSSEETAAAPSDASACATPPTAAFGELERLRAEQEERDAAELGALMKKLDEADVREEEGGGPS